MTAWAIDFAATSFEQWLVFRLLIDSVRVYAGNEQGIFP